MNAPLFDRTPVYARLREVGDRWGLTVVGILPTGCVSHPSDPQPVVFLAEKARDDLSALDVASAEAELDDDLSFASRILLRSELEVSSRGRAILADMREL